MPHEGDSITVHPSTQTVDTGIVANKSCKTSSVFSLADSWAVLGEGGSIAVHPAMQMVDA